MTTHLNPITRRRSGSCASLLALGFAAAGMACESTPLTAPEALPLTSQVPALSVGGTVFEHTMSGMRPLAGVRVRVYQTLPLQRTYQLVDVTSGADGSFNVARPESTNFVRAQAAPGSPYFTPCPPFSWSRDERVELDVHVVAGVVLSTTGMPPSFPTESLVGGYRALISGRVVERTAAGLEPVPAATVAMGDGDAVADTLTDANGRYLLCSVGNPEVAVLVSARKAGYVTASANGLPWFGWNLDFELTRR